MRTLLLPLIMILAAGGCAGTLTTPVALDDTASPTPGTPASIAAQPSPSPTPSTSDKPGDVFFQMSATGHPGYDELVFQFAGEQPPPLPKIRWVDEVRQDPTDDLITLSGKRFLMIVFDGMSLDTTQWESDPSKGRRYTGPRRISPDLDVLKGVVIAGDFEAVLSFGVGLSGDAEPQMKALSSPSRLIIDFRSK